MRLFAAVTAVFAVLLLGATVAWAADIGANDDTAKHSSDGGVGIYAEMAALGLRQTVIPVRFKPSEAIVIQDKQLLDIVIPNALAAGLRVVIAVYPYPPREVEAGLGSPSLFGSYAAAVASIYPQVKQFVIGNEPNQPAFWRPQFGSAGGNVSAKSFGPYLAAAYDALKSVDPALSVVGVGLSPRGNDRPRARNNISTSPVRFLRALGTWYRASGRDRPLMDAFSFHPYPNEATDSLDRGYSWPNAGFVNLDRVKQALWDAFNGTPQPTTLNGLKLHLDEIGWQVETSGRAGYSGLENVPVTDELRQAAIYDDLIRRAACDSDVAEVSFFGFRDDGLRTGFQSALQRADGSARPSAEAVRAAIAETAGGCAREVLQWQPGTAVIGAEVAVDAAATEVKTRVSAGEDARAVVCVRSLPRVPSVLVAPWALEPSCRRTNVIGLRPLTVALPAPAAGDRMEVAVKLAAEANRVRRTVVVEEATLAR